MSKDIRLRAHEAFRFNVMVVGESGLGKSTFLRTMFKVQCEFCVARVLLKPFLVQGFVEDVHQLVPSPTVSENTSATKGALAEGEGAIEMVDDNEEKTVAVRPIGSFEWVRQTLREQPIRPESDGVIPLPFPGEASCRIRSRLSFECRQCH